MALADFQRIDDFGDAAAEAKACRTTCALFDFSFLECTRLEGGGASDVIEAFTGRSLDTLNVGNIRYALRVDAQGHAVADLTVWRTGFDSYDVMSGRREDIADLLCHAGPGICVTDSGSKTVTFALQGPASLKTLSRLGDAGAIEPLGYFSFGHAKLNGIDCRIGRLGYTGEPGFEIIAAKRHARDLWQALAAHARPAGFIATDMLRIEAGFVLFSNEFCLPVAPAEAGLGNFHRAPPAAPKVSLISFRADADRLNWPWLPSRQLKRPAAPGEIVVTSACDSAVAGGILGLGYVLAGTKADLHDPVGVFRNIQRTAMPFYDPAKRRPRAPWRSFQANAG
jgi:glycine cleavage system aminomethyltransferase T